MNGKDMPKLNKCFIYPGLILIFSLIFWGRMIFSVWIRADDWTAIWTYFGSTNFSEFMLPWKNLGHVPLGWIWFFDLKLLELMHSLKAVYIWHGTMVLLYTLNSMMLYFIIKKIYDKDNLLPFFISVFYLGSPIVNTLCTAQQPYLIYLFSFLLSLLLTVNSLTQEKNRKKYNLIAIFLSAFSMLGLESFMVFELSRFVIISYFLKIRNPGKYSWKDLRDAILKWLPFLIMTISMGIYKIFFQVRGGPFVHVYDFPKFNISSIFTMFKTFSHSLYYMFYEIWIIMLKSKHYIPTVILAFSALFLYVIFILRETKNNATDEDSSLKSNKLKFMIFFGVFLLIIGLLPYVLTRGIVTYGIDSRHGLLANVGFWVLVPSVIFWLKNKKIITKEILFVIFAILIFLEGAFTNKLISIYQNYWEKQRSIWWQFVWRVPDLKEKTYLLIDEPRDEYMDVDSRGAHELPALINLLYAKSRDKKEIYNHYADSFLSVVGDWGRIRNLKEEETLLYAGMLKWYPKNLIVASYHNTYLNLNDDIDGNYSTHDVNINSLANDASPSQIIYKDETRTFPFRWLIGPEPSGGQRSFLESIRKSSLEPNVRRYLGSQHYYYQKAQLLVQKGDFKEVVKLYEVAKLHEIVGLYNVTEWLEIKQSLSGILLPFIKSFYIVGDTENGARLLWNWALTPSANITTARKLYEFVRKHCGENSYICNELLKEINKIFGKTS